MKDKILKNSRWILTGFTLSILIVVGHFYYFTKSTLGVDKDGFVLLIPNGTPVKKIVQQLKANQIIRFEWELVLLIRLKGAWNYLKAGEYLIKPGTTPGALIQQLREGRVIQYALTIIPGTTFKELMMTINADPVLSHTLQAFTSEDIMTKLGYPGKHPEGRFCPETYYFPRGTTDVAFLQRAYSQLEHKLTALWQQYKKNLPFNSPYEALILASIVEKETALPEEYREIAGVFIRRLEKNMPLQADPTVIYGLNKEGLDKTFSGTLTKAMLNQPTPYNTYQIMGLPPTPIAFPSEKALVAAMNPKPGNTLYFVAKKSGKGHVFSSTLEEHNAAVMDYRRTISQMGSTLNEN